MPAGPHRQGLKRESIIKKTAIGIIRPGWQVSDIGRFRPAGPLLKSSTANRHN
jgi:hypothetical protein